MITFDPLCQMMLPKYRIKRFVSSLFELQCILHEGQEFHAFLDKIVIINEKLFYVDYINCRKVLLQDRTILSYFRF